jgi:hypothetical protein
MQWFDIAQNTPEWEALRVARIGGSSIKKIMANYGKAFGEPAHALALQIALEKIDGKPHGSGYTNDHFDRGHEQEPIARQLYEDETFCEVSNGGYYIDGDDIGVSPDGNVYSDGLIEIKSRVANIFYETVKRGSYSPAEKWQLYFNMKVSGREWIDYVEFCAEFPEGKRLFIDRIYAKDFQEEFEKIDSRLFEFKKLVGEKLDMIEGFKS